MTAPVEEPQEISRQQKFALVAASAAMVLVAGLNTGWTGPLLPRLAQAEQLSLLQIGLLVSSMSTGCFVSNVVSPVFTGRFGARDCVKIGAVLMCLGFVSVGILAHGVYPLLFSFFVLGFGMGLAGVAVNLLTLENVDSSAARALNRLHLCFGVGALAGPLLAEAALLTPASYRSIFLGGAIATAAVACFLHRLNVPKSKVSNEKASLIDSFNWMQPVFWLYGAVIFLYVGIEAGIATWLFTYLVKVSQIPQSSASAGMSLLWGGMTVGRFLGGQLCTRISPKKIALVSMVVATSGLAALFVFPAEGCFTLVAVALIGLGFGPIYPNTLGEAHGTFPGHAAYVTPVLITFGAVGSIIFPGVLGAVLDRYGLPVIMAVLAVSGVCMIMSFLLMWLTARRRTAPVAASLE